MSYLPLTNSISKLDEYKQCSRIKYKKIAITTVSMPLVGFSICVLLSIWKDFEAANFTHCQVFNFLPSVSASIGSFYPQTMIWKTAIATHSIPRFVIAYSYYYNIKHAVSKKYHFFLFISFLLHIVELVTLIGLSFYSSTENYPVHKTCFVTFVISSQIHMLSLCSLLTLSRALKPLEIDSKSLKIKWYMLFINLASMFLASYFFMRHNSHCEALVYSLFAATEYIVILTNMGFHMTSCYDFKEVIRLGRIVIS